MVKLSDSYTSKPTGESIIYIETLWELSKIKKCSNSMDMHVPPETCRCFANILTDITCGLAISLECLRINYHLFLRVDSKAYITACDKSILACKSIMKRSSMPTTCCNIWTQLIPIFKPASIKPLYRLEAGQVSRPLL